ncbi:MAG: archaetidylinositol phosphate synthase [Chlamydiales bacterium]|jgi:archaetidylinositol phosphate synthase
MIDSYYRDKYQAILVRPIVKIISRSTTIHPKLVTLVACCSGILIIPLLAFSYPYTALIFMLISGYLDTFDGSLARETHKESPQGAVLDIICDRIVEFSIILGLYFVDPVSRSLLCLFMLGSVLICITSFLVVGIFIENATNKSFHYSPGLMERSEAFCLFALMILFPSYFSWFASLFSILVFWTALIRVKEFQENTP